MEPLQDPPRSPKGPPSEPLWSPLGEPQDPPRSPPRSKHARPEPPLDRGGASPELMLARVRLSPSGYSIKLPLSARTRPRRGDDASAVHAPNRSPSERHFRLSSAAYLRLFPALSFFPFGLLFLAWMAITGGAGSRFPAGIADVRKGRVS